MSPLQDGGGEGASRADCPQFEIIVVVVVVVVVVECCCFLIIIIVGSRVARPLDFFM